jgi:dipeptidyl aminopeptidase/acylaminoacyl peptidase
MVQTHPYGSWSSPIAAADVARAGVRLGAVAAVGNETWWTEGRPAEGGRNVVVRLADGERADFFSTRWNARTRVHEYGGACWLPIEAGKALVFANWDDQRLYRVEPDGEPTPLTPEPAEPMGDRYADLVPGPDGQSIWCVRERAIGHHLERAIVSVPLDGSEEVAEIVGGSRFLAYPRISPDGTQLAWIAWEHPQMPWDGTELRVADLDGTRVSGVRTVLGSTVESVLQPEWASPTELYVISDRSGWWNLYRVPAAGGEAAALYPYAEEFAGPLWQLGFSTYAPLPDGRIAVIHGTDDRRLGVLDPETGLLVDTPTPYTVFQPVLSVRGNEVLTVALAADRPGAILAIDVDSGGTEIFREDFDVAPDPAYLPVPTAVTLPGPHSREVHAHVYPPRSPDFVGLDGELPPYLVFVHGGPTAQSFATLDLTKAYFTSRGIGVIDVNYGGSTGYGREYRDRLRGQWGVVDVEDSVAAVLALADRGAADRARLAIRGGSAGGWTTLAALVFSDAFGAGASYYGVAELVHFVEDTHDFESRYIDGLIGPLPEARALYDERAPLSHVDLLSCPVLLLQGLDDKIVPPSQSEMFRDALARKGIRHAYLAYEGEQHGFRKAETIIHSLEAELSFYGQVFGFTPPGIPVIELTTSLPS